MKRGLHTSKKVPVLMKLDMLVVNRVELAPYVNFDIERLRTDTKQSSGNLPYIFGSIRKGVGVPK